MDQNNNNLVFSTVANAAFGFYKTILTVSSSFLGGSLLFLKNIAPSPIKYTYWILGAGWISLIISMILIIKVQRDNLQSGYKRLEGEIEKAKSIDKKTRKLSTCSVYLLSIGLFLIMTFGFINLLK